MYTIMQIDIPMIFQLCPLNSNQISSIVYMGYLKPYHDIQMHSHLIPIIYIIEFPLDSH